MHTVPDDDRGYRAANPKPSLSPYDPRSCQSDDPVVIGGSRLPINRATSTTYDGMVNISREKPEERPPCPTVGSLSYLILSNEARDQFLSQKARRRSVFLPRLLAELLFFAKYFQRF